MAKRSADFLTAAQRRRMSPANVQRLTLSHAIDALRVERVDDARELLEGLATQLRKERRVREWLEVFTPSRRTAKVARPGRLATITLPLPMLFRLAAVASATNKPPCRHARTITAHHVRGLRRYCRACGEDLGASKRSGR